MKFSKILSIILFSICASQAYAKSSNPDFELGLDYFYGNGVKQNYSKAVKYFKKAGQANEVDANLFLGYMYQSELGVKRNFEQAEKFYKLAAKEGSLDAKFQLIMSKNGALVLASLVDPDKYNKLVKQYVDGISKLSDMKHPHSMAIKSLMYINGDIAFDNFKKAKEVNKNLFDKNNELASLIEGVLLIEEGKEVEGWLILDNLSKSASKIVSEYIRQTKKQYFDNRFAKSRGAFGYRISDSLSDFFTRNTASFGKLAAVPSTKGSDKF
jgi:hypothetical protein